MNTAGAVVGVFLVLVARMVRRAGAVAASEVRAPADLLGEPAPATRPVELVGAACARAPACTRAWAALPIAPRSRPPVQ